MSRNPALLHYGVLVVLGASWGFSTSLSKIAVSSGYGQFGLVFWQLTIGGLLMGGLSLARGTGLPLNRRALWVFVLIALLGSIIPGAAFYSSIRHLPAGVLAILLSLLPMIAFPMALALGLERFSLRRFCGIAVGVTGVLVLVMPEASLPEVAMLAWIPVALIALLCYAFESNFVARWGGAGMNPAQVMFGVSLVGALITLPLAIGSGQFINPVRVWGAPEWALVASSAIHVMVYAGYILLVGRAGSVFAVQVSYLVTGFGVIWAVAILGERYSGYIWISLVLVLAGVFLVQPGPRPTPESAVRDRRAGGATPEPWAAR